MIRTMASFENEDVPSGGLKIPSSIIFQVSPLEKYITYNQCNGAAADYMYDREMKGQ